MNTINKIYLLLTLIIATSSAIFSSQEIVQPNISCKDVQGIIYKLLIPAKKIAAIQPARAKYVCRPNKMCKIKYTTQQEQEIEREEETQTIISQVLEDRDKSALVQEMRMLSSLATACGDVDLADELIQFRKLIKKSK